MPTPPEPRSLPEEILVGRHRFRPREGLLASNGERVRLEPKVSALLTYLVRHRDRMVTREELLDSVWTGAVVAPVALARAVSELRAALGDDPRAPSYVETYPKRGYRLVAAVDLEPPAGLEAASPDTLEDPVAAPPPRGLPGRRSLRRLAEWSALALVCMTAASEVRPPRLEASVPPVLVLPFRSLDPGATSLAARLTEDVRAALALAGDVGIAPAGATPSDLQAGTVLEGTVRSAGGEVRMRAVLRDWPRGEELWAESSARPGELDAPGRKEVAARIAHGLRIHGLRARDTRRARMARGVPERAPTAFELFRHGRGLLMSRSVKGTLDAEEAFARALDQEPRFTLARTGRVLALAMRASLADDPSAAREALREAEACVAQDAALPEAHHALGRARLALGRHRQAAAALEEALRLRPDFLMALADRALVSRLQGDLEGAWRAELDLHARDYAPWRAHVRGRLGELTFVAGASSEARRWLEDALRLERHDVEATVALARVEATEGRSEEARRRLLGMLSVEPACQPCLVLLGQLELEAGDRAHARRLLERALDLPGDASEARLALASMESGASRAALLARAEGRARARLADGDESGEPLLALAAVAAQRGDGRSAGRWCERALDAGWRDDGRLRLDPSFGGRSGGSALEACKGRARSLAMTARDRLARGFVPAS